MRNATWWGEGLLKREEEQGKFEDEEEQETEQVVEFKDEDSDDHEERTSEDGEPTCMTYTIMGLWSNCKKKLVVTPLSIASWIFSIQSQIIMEDSKHLNT